MYFIYIDIEFVFLVMRVLKEFFYVDDLKKEKKCIVSVFVFSIDKVYLYMGMFY